MKITYTKNKVDGYYHVIVWKDGKGYRFYRVKHKTDIAAIRMGLGC